MHVVQKDEQNFLYKMTDKSDGFPAAFRLLRENRYDHVFKGRVIKSSKFKIFYTGNFERNARLGIVVSKRLISRAVDRNISKRFIREVFRQHQIKWEKLDVVVMLVSPISPDLSKGRENLNSLLSQIEGRCITY